MHHASRFLFVAGPRNHGDSVAGYVVIDIPFRISNYKFVKRVLVQFYDCHALPVPRGKKTLSSSVGTDDFNYRHKKIDAVDAMDERCAGATPARPADKPQLALIVMLSAVP